MALFTDADVVTLDDLLQFETSLVQVASSHGINVETKISLSTDAISDKLLLWLLRAGASDPQWMTRRLLGLSTVVVTPTLRKWICFDALSRFFAEAYNVQLNTRFQGKWTEYQTQAQSAADMVFMSGLGIVYNALPKPEMPVISIQEGTAAAQSLFVQCSWVDRNGKEGAVSPINGQILNGLTTVAVSMAETAQIVPSAAVGWNLYASATDSNLTLQNAQPISIGTTWQMPGSGLVTGTLPIDGQQPEYYVTLSRQILRG